MLVKNACGRSKFFEISTNLPYFIETYDTLGRPTARNTARQSSVVYDVFFHNTRSELAAANGTNYMYAYDNIRNRTSSTEGLDEENCEICQKIK